MKKPITILSISLAILALPSIALAQGMQQGQEMQPRVVKAPGAQTGEQEERAILYPQGNLQGQGGQEVGGQLGTGAANKGVETAVKSLNRVAERNNNPEIGEQVRAMVENHEKIQVRTETALKKMDQRSQAMKFIIGPDYKNAGQVRSDVVGLRNDIKKLEKIKGASLPTDVEDLQGSIEGLRSEANKLEADLEGRLSGFSLFGWLAKMLN